MWIIDPDAGPKPSVAKGDLIVLDPQGAVKQRLAARGIAFTEVRSLAEIPVRPAVVVVGKDALNPREATDPKWLALAGNGAKVLVLDQANPLHYQALPADLLPTDFVGRVAFEENTAHPIFQGLRAGRLLHLGQGPHRLSQRLHEAHARSELAGALRQANSATRPSPNAR